MQLREGFGLPAPVDGDTAADLAAFLHPYFDGAAVELRLPQLCSSEVRLSCACRALYMHVVVFKPSFVWLYGLLMFSFTVNWVLTVTFQGVKRSGCRIYAP